MVSSYVFRPMNDEEACAVVSWRYEAPYDFYDMANDPEGLEELLGPPERRRGYYAVQSGGELVGFGRRHFAPAGFRLSVAAFNERAIQVYERAGFWRVTVFTHHTNGGDYPFLPMTREA